ncbi:MAG TPA: acetolactate synthase small subunit [Polyangiaceae bacterium]|nr:acetolactate synthase small subunit [Polyangiaceae bacterium]
MLPQSPVTLRTFVAYVEDRPGVLNRIASLFRRRGYNIESLNVGRTHEVGISRMTFRVEADDDMALRVEANLYKMVNVLSVEEISKKPTVSRDLALVKVTVGPDKRAEVLQLCEVFRARAVDVGPDTLIVEITGTQDKIDGLVAILQPFGIAEMVQTGTVAMTRGPKGDAASSAQQPPALRGITAA